MNTGFSLIEIILAVGLFVVFVSGGMGIVIQGLQMNRLGAEQTVATQYATEGIEAVRSIKNKAYTSIVNTASTGITKTGGIWTFSGTENTFGKYRRVISIASVNRDASGNIVATGGTVDPYTKKVTSTVNWNFIGNRNKSINVSEYITNWDGTITRGGMLVFSNGGTSSDLIQYRIFDSIGNWGQIQNVPDFGVPLNRPARVVNLYTSSTRDEKILISRHVANGSGDDQYIYAQVWNGTTQTWGNVQLLASWASATTPQTRNYDGDYLANGNFFIVYDDNTNLPKYRTWNGTTWSNALSNPPNVGGNPDWIVVSTRPGTNEVMLTVRDSGDGTNTAYWNGSTWTVHAEHSSYSPGDAYESIDFFWNTTGTRGALVFNEANDTFPNLRIWNGSAWGTNYENTSAAGNIGGNPRVYRIVSRPNVDEFLACFKDASSDINCLKANPNYPVPIWIAPNPKELTTGTDGGSQRSLSHLFERGGTLGLIIYSINNSTPMYRTYNPTVNPPTFSNPLQLTNLSGNLETVRILQSPDTDNLFVLMLDSTQQLHTVVWNGENNAFDLPGGYAQTVHTGPNAGANDLDMWADFAWDRF